MPVHRNPPLRLRSCRAKRNGLEHRVGTAGEQLKLLARSLDADKLVVERIGDKPLRAKAAVVCRGMNFDAKLLKAVEREKIVLRAPADKETRLYADGEEPACKEVERGNAKAATNEKRRAVAL